MGWFKKKEQSVPVEGELVEKKSTRQISTRTQGSKGLIRRKYRTVRSFDAGKPTRFLADWETSPTPINYQITSVLHTIIARSRAGYQNNPLLKRVVSLMKSNIVGKNGVRYVPKVTNNKGELDEDVNRQINDFLIDARKKGVLEASGLMSEIDLQNQNVQLKAVDGEFIAIKRLGPEFKYGIAYQIIDPMLLPVTLNEDLPNGRKIRCGIELGDYNRPVAYWFIRERKNGHPSSVYHPANKDYVRIEAKWVIHDFDIHFAGQLRGIPQSAVSLLSVEILRKYIEAELVGARVGAMSAGFFVPHQDNPEFDGTGSITTGDPDDDEGDYDPADDELEMEDIEAGSVKIAPAGYDFKPWDLKRPNQAFSDFVKTNIRSVASANDVNYNDLANDYESVSFSSLRHSRLTDEQIWGQKKVWLIEHFLELIYPDIIRTAIALGKVKIKTRYRLDLNDYTKGIFVPPVAKSVDMLKSATAYRILNKDLGVLSRMTIAMALDVVDPEGEFKQVALENEKYPYYNENTANDSDRIAQEEDPANYEDSVEDDSTEGDEEDEDQKQKTKPKG